MATFKASVFIIIFQLWIKISISDRVDEKVTYRLPDNHTPQLYNLNLVVDPDLDTFSGHLNITFLTNNDTNDLLLHASPTRINVTKLILNDIHLCEASYLNSSTEILHLNCPEVIKKGENKIHIIYDGIFGRDGIMNAYWGFFKGTYKTPKGLTSYAATQFQANYARSAFPCFDEPRFKAEFEVTIEHPEKYNALANAKIKSQSTKHGIVKTKFERTPPMPTYLVAFVVSNFEKTCDNSTEFSLDVYSRPSQVKNTGTAIKYTQKLVNALENWTGIKYEDLGIPKLDLVAIPYFTAEAMENWGLMTFEEHVLLDEGRKTSAEDKQYIISLIAHELCHHWFGNYVTLDWWSNLWLNEGFATYFQYFIPDEVEGLDQRRQFVTSILQPVLQEDGLDGRAVSSPYEDVNTGDDIILVFDSISYSKAACLIRMMRSILGDDAFQRSLRSYLRSYAHNTTNPTALLETLGRFYDNGNISLEEIMKNWIYQPGYPIVTASLNKQKNKVMINQEEFRHINDTSHMKGQLWNIPITYATSSNNNFTRNDIKWLTDETLLEIPVQNNEWIIINLQQTGYYRVNYDEELWQRIKETLRSDKMKTIHVANRAQILDDAFYLALLGQLDYEIPMQVARYFEFQNDKEYEPWYVIAKYTKYIRRLLEVNDRHETLYHLKEIVTEWLKETFPSDEKIELTSNLQVLTNQVTFDLKCYMDDEKCLDESQQIFKKYKMTKVVDDYNTRQSAFCFGLKMSKTPEEDYNTLLNYYTNSDSPIERRVIINSLGCISEPAILKKYLSELISSNTTISRPDFRYLIRSVYSNSNTGMNATLSFLKDHLTEIVDKSFGVLGLADIIIEPAKWIVSNYQMNLLKDILAKYKDVPDVDVIGQAALKHPLIYNNRFEINRHYLNSYLYYK